MEYFIFIQKYYIYLVVLFITILPCTVLLYGKGRNVMFALISFFVLLFSGWTVYHLGSRPLTVGIDTRNYFYTFKHFSRLGTFVSRKDFFYDLLNYFISSYWDFAGLLLFAGFVYIFGTLYSFWKLFSKDFFIPFLVFLMSPNFIDFGINVMRSGMAGAIFLIGLGLYYKKRRFVWVYLVMVISMLFHISMIIPLLCFILTFYVKNTRLLFLIWLGSIVLSIVNLNVISSLVNFLNNLSVFQDFTTRAGNYANAQESQNSLYHFSMFGILPIGFAVFNILQLKYKNEFYIKLTNIYILIYIPYTILMNTRFGYRIAFLAEVMMPILLIYPFLIDAKIKIKMLHLKITLIIFILFLIKGYGILSM